MTTEDWEIDQLREEIELLWGAIRILLTRSGTADPMATLHPDYTVSPEWDLVRRGRELRSAMKAEQRAHELSRQVRLPKRRRKTK